MAFGNDIGLLFRIQGDASGAVAAINSTYQASNKLTGTFSSLTGSFASLANPATLAATAITAIGTAALATVATLFDFSRSAAEFGDEIFDASEKTGLGAETLSALKIAAEQSGSSFEGVTGAISKFNVLLGEANEGSKKAQATLEKYNITATDTQGALEQAVKAIASMESADRQAAAAKALFRDRTAEILPVIKSFDGDLPGLISKLREMGVLLGDKDAAAAGKFNDQMGMLNTQLAAIGRTIGFSVMPIFLEWATKLSDWLAKNSGEIARWATAFGKAMEFIAASIVNNIDAFAGLAEIIIAITTSDWNRASSGIQRIGNAIAAQQGAWKSLRTPSDSRVQAAGRVAGGGRDQSLDDEEAKKEAEKRRKEREAALKKELADLDSNIRLRIESERQGYEDAQKDWETSFIAKKVTEDQFRAESLKNLRLYIGNVRTLIFDQLKNDKKQASTALERQNAELNAQKAAAAILREYKQQQTDLNKTIADQSKKTWDEERDHYDWLIATEIYYKGLIFDRMEAQQKFLESLPNASILILPDTKGPEGEPAGIFDAWTESWERFIASIEENAPTVKSTLGGVADLMQTAFEGLAQAIGSVVEQYVLYGEAGPDALRKVLAATLAQIAAEAAVQAIRAAAYGFLFLATGNYAAAANAFISAALWGSIAVGAALAGRAIAPKQEGQAAFRSSTASSSSRSQSNENQTPISRQNEDTFTSGRGTPFQQMQQFVDAVVGIEKKISSMRPEDVLTVGARRRPEVVGNAYNDAVAKNPSIGTKSQRLTGGR